MIYKIIKGINYRLDEENLTAEVIGQGNGYEGDIIIPETVVFQEVAYRVTSIGKNAFLWCKSLTSVTIPNSVTRIGESGFSGCKSLTSIVIPDGVTRVEERTFYDCKSLKSVVIGKGVTRIAANAFMGCKSLKQKPTQEIEMSNLRYTLINHHAMVIGYSECPKTINIPTEINHEGVIYRVTSIGEQAFKGCPSLNSIVIPDSVTSIGKEAFQHCSSLTSVVIPDSVTSIGEWTFSDCSSLTSIVIPESVKSIGNWAFEGCSSLTSIVIPDGVTRIEWEAFKGCKSLTSIVIPDGVTSIGVCAFSSCSSLTSIVIPDSVTSIGGGAFSGCSSLTSVVVAEGNTVYDSREQCNAIIRTATNTLISGCQNTIIPDSVTSIGGGAFSGRSSLTSIVIPDSVTSIGGGAFSGCSSLTSMVIPDGVKSIGESAFEGCSSLTSIVIPDGVTRIRKETFYGCSSLTSIVIPDSVTSIGEEAFEGCDSLKQKPTQEIEMINIKYRLFMHNHLAMVSGFPGRSRKIRKINILSEINHEGVIYRVTSIGERAFDYCSSLTSIVIPDSVTSIGESAFTQCEHLTSIVIPDGVTSIGERAFSSCLSLTSIVIPESVKSIGENAFNCCCSLTSVVVAEGNTVYDSREQCNAIIHTATNTLIRGCHNTIIPDSVTSIGGWAFDSCDSLTSIVIPDGVTSIGEGAFALCSSLKQSPTQEIEMSNCKYRLLMHNHLAMVLGYSGHSKTINIPSEINHEGVMYRVTSIGEWAFDSCDSLTSITFNGTKAQWEKIQLGVGWNESLLTTVVRCTDGKVKI